MHRTLFSPTMIETFRACKHAYELAFLQSDFEQNINQAPGKMGIACKQYILRGLAQINRGKITTATQVQKYMGQTWPLGKVGDFVNDKEATTQAFLFSYKTLLRYVNKPYLPRKAKVVGVALKVRARVPHARVYVEDTLDLVLLYPEEKRLEFVDFHVRPIKGFDPAWPSASLLVKKFLAERLQTRWDFEELAMTANRVGIQDFPAISIDLEESTYRLHWSELVDTLEQMKQFEGSETRSYAPHIDGFCRHCEMLAMRLNNLDSSYSSLHSFEVSRTA